jgi:D-alanyl-D-alanine carboxypeptidase/D-alanyl-D-alanine-endopeptidase (penicillin-binding protein 4)
MAAAVGACVVAAMGVCAVAAVGQAAGTAEEGKAGAPVAAGQVVEAVEGRGAGVLGERIAGILGAGDVARDHWGIQVTTLDGAVLYSLNEGKLFQPASNAKLFTTAAALALLGPDQRFTTRVQYELAGYKSSTIGGDVVIVGTGDGGLNDGALNDRALKDGELADRSSAEGEGVALQILAEFADEIAANGVRHIEGNIVGDDTVFPWEPYARDLAIDDMVWGYAAPVSGLSVNDNELRLTVTPGQTVKDAPRVEWQAGMPPYYALNVSGVVTGAAGSGRHVQMEREAGSKTVRVYGSIAVDAVPDVEEIAVADPAEFAAITLKAMLEARGVVVDGTARAKHRSITQGVGFMAESHGALPGLRREAMPASDSAFLTGIVDCYNVCPVMLQHTSPTVQQDVMLTNKMSLNLHAELLLRQMGKRYGETKEGGADGDGSIAEGVRVVRQFVVNAGIDGEDFVFFDGSGLSGHDLVTPRATAKLLQFAATQPWGAEWKASLSVGGVDGTLAGRFMKAPLKGHVFAKTGTLGEARALSGYVDAASGRTIIFSILVGNHLPGDAADRVAMDRIVAAIQAAE